MSTERLALPKWRVHLQEYIINEVLHADSARILDVGCGVGHGVVLAAMLGKDVVGVDVSRSALHQATERAKQKSLRNLTELIRCSVVNLPFRLGSFDEILCILLVDALQKLEQPLKEIAQVLDFRGKLVIADLDPTACSMMTIGKIIQFVDRRSGHPYWLHSPSVVGETLRRLGFKFVKKQRKHMGLGAPIYILELEKT
jgi:ubiquinone/menaquinone biosynthesis C-methylase UbiE